jgi:hypothetical protein
VAAITTPFGLHSTAAEVAAGIDLAVKRAIVTGGGSGIGVETAMTLPILAMPSACGRARSSCSADPRAG